MGRLPDFIIPGFSRSGTSSMREMLATHPDIFTPGNPDFDTLRQYVSQWVLSRMIAEFQDDRSVEWTPNVIFQAEGIAYKSGLLKNKPQMLPYDQIESTELDAGQFCIYSRREKKAQIRLESSGRNFYPG